MTCLLHVPICTTKTANLYPKCYSYNHFHVSECGYKALKYKCNLTLSSLIQRRSKQNLVRRAGLRMRKRRSINFERNDKEIIERV